MLIRYCWNKSVPADSEMGLATLRFSLAVKSETRSSVSLTVDAGVLARPRMRASMAATGMVRSGSSASRRLYSSATSNAPAPARGGAPVVNMRAFGGRPGSGGGVVVPMSGMSDGSRAVVTLSPEGGGVCGRRCWSGGTFRKFESCAKVCLEARWWC
jgi:hypothetical protein